MFVHLRLHSEFSIVDSTIRIPEIVQKAHTLGMPALALTDLSNVFGMVKFYAAARALGIKPILGCEVWVSSPYYAIHTRMIVLCQNRAGYLHLCALLSRAYQEKLANQVPVIQAAWLAENNEGLILLSGGLFGELATHIVQGHTERAQATALYWQQHVPNRFYIELQRAENPHTDLYEEHVLPIAQSLALPIVATHPVQFLEASHFKAHEARVAISQGVTLSDPRRPADFKESHYLQSAEEMSSRFADLPEAIMNTQAIAERCSLTLELGTYFLPQFPAPENTTLEDHLQTQARLGLAQRMQQLFVDTHQRQAQQDKYAERLETELTMIVRTGFAGYFLIVADFINWAKQQGIPVGPGRGSGAGSLVAFSLGITDLDPLRYDLLFERFINPERVSLPDFDIDFCQDRREEVIAYVRSKYGAQAVSQIVTFGTMAAKAVVRDVGRVLDLPYPFVDQLAKLIPFEIGMTLAKARKQEPQLQARAEKEEEVSELLILAEQLEGLTRNVGMHAGGVLIAPGSLTHFCPIYVTEEGHAVSQFDKDDVEQIGLVKFDFLGLKTLTVIDHAVRILNAQIQNGLVTPLSATQAVRIEHIPLDDVRTYQLLKKCQTMAVFQLESRGMRDLIRRLQPDTFEDVIALVALFRPGPLQSGMVDDFINRKQGRAAVDYLVPALEPILRPTYGVIVYQEQVMQIAQVLAGYSLGAADLLRRAMGKKKPEEMAKQRSIFVQGCMERGIAQDKAEYLFNLMEKFAEYGFNKSHSAAYALLAYQTAFLKAHAPAAFMAAVLTCDLGDTDKVRDLISDARELGLTILPPDINASEYAFVAIDETHLRYGLGAIKGTGESAVAHLVSERTARGAFANLWDFCKRCDKRIVNRRTVESLIRAGAFDALDSNRAQLLADVSVVLEWAEQQQRAKTQVGLFDTLADEVSIFPSTTALPAWNTWEQLMQEKQAMGFYFSGHPFHAYRPLFTQLKSTPLEQLKPQEGTYLTGGIVVGIRHQQTRRGRMAFITLDNGVVRQDVTVFSELFEMVRDALREDACILLQGKTNADDFSGGVRVVVDKLWVVTDYGAQWVSQIHVKIEDANLLPPLQTLFAQFPGTCPVQIAYQRENIACILEYKNPGLAISGHSIHALHTALGIENVRLEYQLPKNDRIDIAELAA